MRGCHHCACPASARMGAGRDSRCVPELKDGRGLLVVYGGLQNGLSGEGIVVLPVLWGMSRYFENPGHSFRGYVIRAIHNVITMIFGRGMLFLQPLYPLPALLQNPALRLRPVRAAFPT